MDKPTKILVIGAGGHGQVVADILLTRNRAGDNITIPAFLDKDSRLTGKNLIGIPVAGGEEELATIPHDALVLGIGDNRIRQQARVRLRQQGEAFYSAIHPRAVVGAEVDIGNGCVVCANVVINIGSRIGEQVILNTSCSVDHHNHIGDFVHIAPGAHLGGDVTVGEGTLVGLGALVLPQIRIGKWAVIGAGAVVIKDIPDFAVAVGNPAKIIKKINE
jgi:sugar O-acyltransferase (sialic acid O-acetyltransferase NeuD family)